MKAFVYIPIANPGLSEEDDPHITILYCEIPTSRKGDFLKVCNEVLSPYLPLRVSVDQPDQFNHVDKVVNYWSVRFDRDMDYARRVLISRLEDVGIQIEDKHPVFTPHITINYDGNKPQRQARFETRIEAFKVKFGDKQSKKACVIATGVWDKKRCLLKNRDRNYTPKVRIIHEEIDGIEVAYMLDEGTDWSEGMNEFGIGVVNSALMVGRDESEKKIVKSVGKKSNDGEKIRKALSKKTLQDALDIVCKYKGGVKGHTFISDKDKTFSVEMTSRHECITKEIDKDEVHVRTNHGFNYGDAGYTDGEDYVSSVMRRNDAEKALKEVKKPKDLALELARQRKKDKADPNNTVRDTDNMKTTTQIMMNLSDLELNLYLIPKNVDFVKVDNKLPGKREPKIKVNILKYQNWRGEPKLKKHASHGDAQKLLSNLLAYLRAAREAHKTAHWQASGPTFYADHLMFDRLYKSLKTEVDTLAEKMVSMFGGKAVELSDQLEIQTYLASVWEKQQDLIVRALVIEEGIQRMFEATYEKLEEIGFMTLGLDDFIMGSASEHETNLYLIKQRLGESLVREYQ